MQYHAKLRFQESQFRAEYLAQVTNQAGARILRAMRFYIVISPFRVVCVRFEIKEYLTADSAAITAISV